ncbi:hypothetical protein PoB_006167700 [Plakobranchus ocellatus]|uniref:Uncharacterized protein n=1 Tax=Plakobranchus ocellatus TaxID=259542 RepID=A0AAV4CTF1_9GAST|nr:hypothetical protein PoB_006167700 [Plakobranchus ocellatus]
MATGRPAEWAAMLLEDILVDAGQKCYEYGSRHAAHVPLVSHAVSARSGSGACLLIKVRKLLMLCSYFKFGSTLQCPENRKIDRPQSVSGWPLPVYL